MRPVTFNQLLAKHLFGIPLPTENDKKTCRECGGACSGEWQTVLEEEFATIKKQIKKEYKEKGIEPEFDKYHEYKGKTINDEGIIACMESPYICEGCHLLMKGSTSRDILVPSNEFGDQLCIVTPSFMYPPPESTKKAFIGTTTKDLVYVDDGYTILQFLRDLPNIETPFGVIIQHGSENPKHIYRAVPLNFNVGENIILGTIPKSIFIEINWKITKKAAEEAVLLMPDNASDKVKKEIVSQIAEKYDLRESEKIVVGTIFRKKEVDETAKAKKALKKQEAEAKKAEKLAEKLKNKKEGN